MMMNLHTPSSSIYLFGVDLSGYSRLIQFLLTSTAVLIFHVLQGYIQELILQLKSLRLYPNYFTLVYFICFTCLAYLERLIFERTIKRRKAPIPTYALIALFTLGTMGLSNAAVMRLNYPTHMMFKSCKLIPVMIGSMLILGKRYNLYDVLACLCMTVGLIFFTLADSQVQPEFDLLGVWLVCCALVADAVIGNVQEKALKEYKPSNSEMILFSYSIGAIYLLLYDITFGSLKEAFWLWWAHPIKSYVFTMAYSFAGYLGVNCVLNLVRHFGALIAVTVTTFRKTITIILSFIAFTKPFTFQYLWSGAIVAFGIYLNAYGQNQKSIENYTRSMYNHLLMKFRRRSTSYRFPTEEV
ncbi:unnamed protein product [Rotaria sp. Silwood1]|nr:unnamed protein product [Rotaria sp. Silwood1]CAF1578653.1 unnamed protein product [Rotaria sp. Silwood1]CAF1578920.1 unnamed protein product [Rotaria sp. Silwood1]CAF3688231.1 unnamed protein product [Rotaria sp. Silwood1]CAF3701244.1 unnamed protein product [Rotaria sp. Silwood1]